MAKEQEYADLVASRSEYITKSPEQVISEFKGEDRGDFVQYETSVPGTFLLVGKQPLVKQEFEADQAINLILAKEANPDLFVKKSLITRVWESVVDFVWGL